MSESFQTPTSMLPCSRKPTPPNIFFSSTPFLRARASRMRAARVSSKAIAVLWSSVLNSRFVDRHSSLCHQVHGVSGWRDRQLLEAHLHDEFGAGFLGLP